MKAIYINGINTTHEEAEAQAAVLNQMLDCKVVLCYNPTFSEKVKYVGVVVDLLESAYNRFLPWAPNLPVTRKLLAMINSEVKEQRDTVIIAHSQGTAIAAKAMDSLEKVYRTYVQAHFFANVNSFEPQGFWGELFVNDDDPVRDGMVVSNRVIRLCNWLRKPERKWKQYTRTGNVHGFISGHLNRLSEFTGFSESHFYHLMKKQY